jgi:hypothetical protein
VGFKEKLEFLIDVDDKASHQFKAIGKSADDSLAKGTALGTQFSGAFERAAAKSPLLSGALDKVGLSATQAGTAMATALPGAALVAGGAIAAFGIKAVGDFQDLAGAILDFQRVAGTSAEDSSRLVAVLDDYEISAEAGATAIGKMAKAAANSPESFAKFGVEIAKNKDGTTDLQGTLLNAAEAYQSTGDDAEKAALGAALFGRGYQQLIPILEKGADGADGLSAALEDVSGQQIMSQDQLDQAEDTRLALDRLKDAAREITLTFGSALSPALEEFANKLSTMVEIANKGTAPFGGLGDAFGKLLTVTEAVMFPVKFLGDELIGLATAGDKVTLSTSTLAAEVERVGRIQDATAGSTAALEHALGLEATQSDITAGAVLGTEIATKNKAAADEAAKAKADELSAALDAQRAAADALYASTNALFDADLAYRNSVDSTEDSVNAFREALTAATEAGGLNAEANEALDDATRGAEGAILAEAEAAVTAADKQAELSGATLTAAEKADVQRGALEELKNKYPELAGPIQAYIDKLNTIPRRITTFVEVVHADPGHAPTGGTATGGTFEDGQVRHAATGITFAHVGEQGPERVALFGNGRVLSRTDTIEASRPRSAGAALVINEAHFHDAVDVDVLAQRVLFAMTRAG